MNSTLEFQVVHHTLSAIAVGYSMYTGEGQLYTFMVLISELTTPEINLRWYVLEIDAMNLLVPLQINKFSYWCRYLDTAGLKKSSAYLINGVVIFFAWMVSLTLKSFLSLRWNFQPIYIE